MIRWAKNNYLLGSDKVLPYLKDYLALIEETQNHGLNMIGVKNIRTSIFKAIITHWLNSKLNKAKAKRVAYRLTDTCSF